MAQNTISIGFEDQIWKAEDLLRGNLNASEYEGVVLGLIFLKYISDKFEARHSELLQDPYADPEDKDEYTAENVFFEPATKDTPNAVFRTAAEISTKLTYEGNIR